MSELSYENDLEVALTADLKCPFPRDEVYVFLGLLHPAVCGGDTVADVKKNRAKVVSHWVTQRWRLRGIGDDDSVFKRYFPHLVPKEIKEGLQQLKAFQDFLGDAYETKLCEFLVDRAIHYLEWQERQGKQGLKQQTPIYIEYEQPFRTNLLQMCFDFA